MYARWTAAGNEPELAVYPGSPHMFTVLGLPQGLEADARLDACLQRAIA
jgi:hypothetical protein